MIKEQKLKIKDLKDSNTALLHEISNLKRARQDEGSTTTQELNNLHLEHTELQFKFRKLDDNLKTSQDNNRDLETKNSLLEKKLEKAAMVLENNERQHQTEMKLARPTCRA